MYWFNLWFSRLIPPVDCFFWGIYLFVGAAKWQQKNVFLPVFRTGWQWKRDEYNTNYSCGSFQRTGKSEL